MELTEGIRNALKTAAAALKGHARRVFVAQVVRDLGRGGQRQAQAQWGWSRDTIRKGEHELSTGIECVDARSATGAKPIDARLPNLRQDIRDLVDGQSQADPRFESERVYCKLSAAKVVELLIDKKGYRSVALPSNETIRNILNDGIDTLVLNLDNGPENNSRRTQFIQRVVDFVDEHQITVRLAYYPPYHSKYNPVERVWGVLENEWNGDLLDTIPAALGHARSMTCNGNHPVVRFVDKVYESGKKLGAAAMRALEKRLQRTPGLEKWFVHVAPRPQPG